MSRIMLTGFTDEIAAGLDTQLAIAGAMGLSQLEIRNVEGRNISEYDAATEGEALHARIAKLGFQVSAIGSPIGKIRIDEAFAPHFEAFKNTVALAGMLKTRYIRLFSFYMPEGADPAAHRGEVLRRLACLVEYAARKGVVLLHENEKGIYGDNAVRCLDLLKHLESPHFRAVFDFANFVQCGQDTAEAYALLRPYVDYIHVKDAMKQDGKVTPAGLGDGQVAHLLSKFKASGYQGYLSIEPHLSGLEGFSTLGKAASFAIAASALKGILWDLDWR